MNIPRALGALFASTAVATTALAASDAYLGPDPVPEVNIRYLSFPSSQAGRPIVIAGRLRSWSKVCEV